MAGITGTAWQAREAQKRLAQTEKANEILGSIFEDLDPNEIAKKERPLQAILLDKLDTAVEQLQNMSIGDPPVVARMQNRLAHSLVGLGAPGKAVVLLEEPSSTFQAEPESKHPDTLSCMNELGRAYWSEGQRDKALPLLQEALELAKTLHGFEHSDTLRGLSNLAAAYGAAKRHKESIPLLEETGRPIVPEVAPTSST